MRNFSSIIFTSFNSANGSYNKNRRIANPAEQVEQVDRVANQAEQVERIANQAERVWQKIQKRELPRLHVSRKIIVFLQKTKPSIYRKTNKHETDYNQGRRERMPV